MYSLEESWLGVWVNCLPFAFSFINCSSVFKLHACNVAALLFILGDSAGWFIYEAKSFKILSQLNTNDFSKCPFTLVPFETFATLVMP